jgi:hypothetical protein
MTLIIGFAPSDTVRTVRELYKPGRPLMIVTDDTDEVRSEMPRDCRMNDLFLVESALGPNRRSPIFTIATRSGFVFDRIILPVDPLRRAPAAGVDLREFFEALLDNDLLCLDLKGLVRLHAQSTAPSGHVVDCVWEFFRWLSMRLADQTRVVLTEINLSTRGARH